MPRPKRLRTGAVCATAMAFLMAALWLNMRTPPSATQVGASGGPKVDVKLIASVGVPASSLLPSEPAALATGAYSLATLPLSFIENRGPNADTVPFYARKDGATVLFRRDGFTLRSTLRLPKSEPGAPGANSWTHAHDRISFHFEGSSPQVAMVGEGKLKGKINYLFGNDRSKWLRNIPTYQSLRYRGLYPGVDAVVVEREGQLAYDLLLAPGASVDQIVVRVDGIHDMYLDDTGSLNLDTRGATLRQSPPVAWYQLPSGEREPVQCRFRRIDERRYGFAIQEPRIELAMVIDPTMTYSTFFGGTDRDRANAVAVDSSGCVYIAGSTYSNPCDNNCDGNDEGDELFPIKGAYDGGLSGCSDVFVAKLDPSQSTPANQLVYSTYIGGGDVDTAFGIAVNSSGEAHITGITLYAFSPDFPTTSGAYRTSPDPLSTQDGFVTKFNADGDGLVYSTLLGDEGADEARAIALDGAGLIYITGFTLGCFPTTTGAFLTSMSGKAAAFVSVIDSSQTGSAGLLYSTYLDGPDSTLQTVGLGITADPSGTTPLIYVTGATEDPDFKGVASNVNGFDKILCESVNGNFDAFVCVFDRSQTTPANQLTYGTFLGGGCDENTWELPGGCNPLDGTKCPPNTSVIDGQAAGGRAAIAIDGDGDIYVTGMTHSGTDNPGSCDDPFPTTTCAFDTKLNDDGMCTTSFPFSDAFFVKLDPDVTGSSSLLYGTYLGGDHSEGGIGIAVFSEMAYITGWTDSTDFPDTDGSSLAGSTDAFVARFQTTGCGSDDLNFATFLGGNNSESGISIAVVASASQEGVVDVHVVGFTDDHTTVAFPTTNEFQSTNAGCGDAFLTIYEMSDKETSCSCPP